MTSLDPIGRRKEHMLRAPVLSATLIVLLVASAITDLVLIVMSGMLWWKSLGGGRNYVDAAQGFDQTVRVAMIAAITTYLFFVWWLAHRSAQIARLRAVGQVYGPRFIAIMSLVPPLIGITMLSIVRELWRSSSTPVDFLDTRSWQKLPVENAITKWWGAVLVASIVCGLWSLYPLNLTSGRQMFEEQLPRHMLSTIAVALLQLAAISLTIPLVLNISRRQLERFRVIQKRYEARAPGPAGAPFVGVAARVPLSPVHCFKVLAIAFVFQALFILAAVAFELPVWCHLISAQAILVAAGITLSRSEDVPLSRLAGLSKPESREMAGAFLVGLGAFCLAAMLLFPWITERFETEAQKVQLRELAEAVPSFVILFPILVIVVAPLVEEILFRGVLFEALASALPTPVVIVLTAAVFALMHGNVPQMIATFVLGLHCGLLRALFGSVGPAIVVHCVNNVAALLVLPAIAGETLPDVLIFPAMMSLFLGYRIALKHWNPEPLARVAEPLATTDHPTSRIAKPLTATGDKGVSVHDRRRQAEAESPADSVAQGSKPESKKSPLPHEQLKVTAARTARTAEPALRLLRAQRFGGPLAHGLAIVLAILYALVYLRTTALLLRHGTLPLVLTAFFSFWAWEMWREHKAQSVTCLILFVLMRLMSRDLSMWDFLAVALFAQGIVAIFRGNHVRSLSHEVVMPPRVPADLAESDDPDNADDKYPLVKL